jgi:hypothetical protein
VVHLVPPFLVDLLKDLAGQQQLMSLLEAGQINDLVGKFLLPGYGFL